MELKIGSRLLEIISWEFSSLWTLRFLTTLPKKVLNALASCLSPEIIFFLHSWKYWFFLVNFLLSLTILLSSLERYFFVCYIVSLIHLFSLLRTYYEALSVSLWLSVDSYWQSWNCLLKHVFVCFGTCLSRTDKITYWS